jgi:hypothetical protein
MPDALRIGVLGPLQVRDGAAPSVPIGGRQLRVLLILLAPDAGRVVFSCRPRCPAAHRPADFGPPARDFGP